MNINSPFSNLTPNSFHFENQKGTFYLGSLRCFLRIEIGVVLILSLFLPLAYADDTHSNSKTQWEFKLQLDGLKAPLLDPVRNHLHPPDQKNLHPFAVRRFCRNAPDYLREALASFGYYSATITDTFEQHDSLLSCHLNVILGKPVRIRNLTITIEGPGGNSPEFKAATARFPLKPNQVLTHARYESGKASLTDLAVALGYFNMRVETSEVKVYPEELAADIDILIDSGERYQFGSLLFAEGPLADEFLQRFSPFEPGDPYEANKMLKLRQGLMESRYFHSVRVDRRLDEENSLEVIIYADYEMQPKYNFTTRVGIGTDTGPRMGFGVENRYVGEMGNRYSINTSLSGVRKEVGVNYMVPRTTPHADRYEFSLGFRREDTAGVSSDLGTFRVQRIYLRDNRWQQTQYLRFHQENSQITGAAQHTRLLIPGIQWTQGVSNDLLYPTQGWRVLFDISGGHEALVSDFTFLQGRSEVKWISSPINRLRLLARAEAGGTLVEELIDLPASLRFFAGGDQSVRGYSYKSLGPRRAGQVIGGRFLLTGSVESDYKFAKNFAVAVFADAGNAFDTNEYQLKKSAGCGVRWFSPVGPIRFDIAWPVGDSSESWRVHLTMGPDL